MLVFRKAIAMILALIAQQQAAEKSFKPLGEITGMDTAIERPMTAMVTDQKQMNNLWAQHKELFGERQNTGGIAVAEREVPIVDFKKNVVIAYFAGQTQGVDGFEIAEINAKGKTAIVRIAPKPFPVPGYIANAFGMWVFTKPTKSIELELITGYQNGQPIVRKLARFEPPKEAKN